MRQSTGAMLLMFSLVVVLTVFLFLQYRRDAILEADNQAAARVLTDFHHEFLRSREIPWPDYIAGLEETRREFPHFRFLDDYIKSCRAAPDGSAGLVDDAEGRRCSDSADSI